MNSTPPVPRWVKYQKAAEELSVSRRSIERYVKAGKLVAAGKGSGRRILYDSVLNYQRQNGGHDA